MPPEYRGTLDAQHALAAWIRDPDGHPPPPGIEPRRLAVYAELVFNNIESLLAGTFPVAKATLGDAAWHAVVRAFIREHGAQTPVFTELPRELLRYLDVRTAENRGDPAWLPELAHYEWIELALQLSDERPQDVPHDPAGDLRGGVPVLSPLAWPLAYDWPVHRIAPDAIPGVPSETLLLVYREPDGTVRFHELAPLAFHLLQRLGDEPTASGEALLHALALEAGAPDVDAFLAHGIDLLERYRGAGIVLGTRA